jgi:hypothetical protein
MVGGTVVDVVDVVVVEVLVVVEVEVDVVAIADEELAAGRAPSPQAHTSNVSRTSARRLIAPS